MPLFQYGTRERVMAMGEVKRFEQPLCTRVATPVQCGLGSMDAPVAASSQAPAVQRRGKSDDLWEAHKATIKFLYIDEGRSLKEVMEIMKSKYGFEAS